MCSAQTDAHAYKTLAAALRVEEAMLDVRVRWLWHSVFDEDDGMQTPCCACRHANPAQRPGFAETLLRLRGLYRDLRTAALWRC